MLNLEQVKGKSFPFSIIKEDYKGQFGTKHFCEGTDCPFIVAFKRQFPDIEVIKCSIDDIRNENSIIAIIEPQFGHRNYRELKENKNESATFDTTITFKD